MFFNTPTRFPEVVVRRLRSASPTHWARAIRCPKALFTFRREDDSVHAQLFGTGRGVFFLEHEECCPSGAVS